jgi:DNA-binding IclR family transcriptional regulator
MFDTAGLGERFTRSQIGLLKLVAESGALKASYRQIAIITGFGRRRVQRDMQRLLMRGALRADRPGGNFYRLGSEFARWEAGHRSS